MDCHYHRVSTGHAHVLWVVCLAQWLMCMTVHHMQGGTEEGHAYRLRRAAL